MLQFFLAILILSTITGQTSESPEDLYKRLLYQLSGEFSNATVQHLRANETLFTDSPIYKLSVTPINMTIFPYNETFYIREEFSNVTVSQSLMTLQLNGTLSIELNMHYFLPGVDIPDEITNTTFFNSFSLDSLDTSPNNCSGSFVFTNFTDLPFIASINICNFHRQNPKTYLIDITCDGFTMYYNKDGEIDYYRVVSQSRPDFPPGWRVNPC